jgi:hypothetical protein
MVWIAGRYIAMVQDSFDPAGGVAETLSVADLSRRDKPVTLADGECPLCGFFPSVVLTAGGGIAYIAGLGLSDEPYRVFSCDHSCVATPSTQPQILDEDGVQPHSLRRSGDMLTWRSNGTPKSAPLP